MGEKIKTYQIRVSENGTRYRGYIAEEENTLKAEQQFVGGYIEVIRLVDNMVMIINEDGKNRNLPPNRLWFKEGQYQDIIVGNIECVRFNEEGDFLSIEEEDIPKIEKCLLPFKTFGFKKGLDIRVEICPENLLPEWKNN